MVTRCTQWLWVFSFVLIVLLLFTLTYWISCGGETEREKRQLLQAPVLTARTFNALSYLFIAGVEGVGHHGISPAIATIAKTCGKHVLYEINRLRVDQQRKDSRNIRLQLAMFRSMPYSARDVVIIDDWSFPSAKICRTCSSEQIKATPYYNLEWMHQELLAFMPTMSVKYLYLNRDFYRTVSSHPDFEGTFERHAHVLHEFIQYLRSEYTIISKKQPDIWRQISYEWFTNMDMYNCTAIVSAVIDFMQWDHCDVEYACHVLNATVHKERFKPIIPEEYAYVQAFDVTLPIPVLDISPNITYNFTTKVSKRLPIVIVSDSLRKKRTSNVKRRSGIDAAAPAPPSIVSSADVPTKQNRVTLLYLVGLQGSDLSTVSTVLSIVAKTANYHVIHMHPVLTRAQKELQAVDFKATLAMFKNFHFADTSDVLILFHKAFPLAEELPEPPQVDKFRSGAYNLLWVSTQAQELGYQVKFLYLQRDLEHVVMSVPPALLDLPLEKRAALLKEYGTYIQEEFQRVEDQHAGLWAQLRYEWFTQAQRGPITSAKNGSAIDCTALVSAIAHQVGWAAVRADRCCQHLRGMTFLTPAVALSQNETLVIAAAHIELSIPLLDLGVRGTQSMTQDSSTLVQGHAPSVRRHRPHLPPKPKQSAAARISTPPASFVAAAGVRGSGKTGSLPVVAAAKVEEAVPAQTNAVSLLYLIGLQGAGLETVAAALTSIAQAANYRVIAQHPQLLRAQQLYEGALYKETLVSLKSTQLEGTSKVLILMHCALPVLRAMENASSVLDDDPINILWVLTQAEEERVKLKVLYVQRDLHQVLASLPPVLQLLPLGDRLQMLQDSVVLVQEEHQRVEDQQAGLWSQLRYEWFAHTSLATNHTGAAITPNEVMASKADAAKSSSCVALVSAVAHHLGWEGCDKDTACDAIKTVNFLSPILALSAEEQEEVAAANVTLSVPYVDIARTENSQAEESNGPGVFQSTGRWYRGKRIAAVKGPAHRNDGG